MHIQVNFSNPSRLYSHLKCRVSAARIYVCRNEKHFIFYLYLTMGKCDCMSTYDKKGVPLRCKN
jgi:hypothetical protein